jgi:hypothetical protein
MRKTNIRDLAKPRVVRQSRKSQKWLEKTGTVFRTGQDENVFGQTFACLPRTRESRVRGDRRRKPLRSVDRRPAFAMALTTTTSRP